MFMHFENLTQELERREWSEKVQDPKYFSEHAYIAVVREGSEGENVFYKPYLNLSVIMKLSVDGYLDDQSVGSIRVTDRLLDSVGIKLKDAWEMAMANSQKTAKIQSMFEAIGIATEEDDSPMRVASTNGGHDGASVICFPDVFGEYCSQKELEALYIIPSSTQEVVVLPVELSLKAEELLQLNVQVNQDEVAEQIRLEPAIYRYDKADNKISIVAALEKEVA